MSDPWPNDIPLNTEACKYCTFPLCACDCLDNGDHKCMKKEPEPREPRRLLSILTSAERKKYPMCTGLLDYFPDALAMVAHVSYLGNEKHNPGQPLHWSRAKSADHPDCIVRHAVERGGKDAEGIRHSAEGVWRALANLQVELEKEFNLDPPRGAG